MKFVTHLADLVNQNILFKVVSGILATLLVVSICIIFALSLRKPIVVELGPETRLAKTSDKGPSEDEVKNFIYKVLPQRFDSDVTPERAYFEDGEILAKSKEQNILKDRNIKQRLLVGDIEIKGDTAFVKSDRLISVADVKSVLTLGLKVQLRQEARSESNPYGLIITRVEPISESSPKKDKQ